jgi:hypothetical protein
LTFFKLTLEGNDEYGASKSVGGTASITLNI